MINICLSLLYLLLTFSIALLCYKKCGKYGLYILMSLLVVISNIETIKIIDVFGLAISLGNITYGGLYLCTDILNEKYGEEYAIKATKISFISQVIFTILIYLFLQYIPSSSDFSQRSLETIFNLIPRITLGSLTAYFISSRCDAKIYRFLKNKYHKVYISNNVSTFISEIIDTIIFVSIGLIGTLPFNEILELFITMLISKWLIALLDTPFMILATKIKNVKELD